MNDELKTLFDGYRPDLGDADEYMARLQRKLTAMEAVRRYSCEQRRLWRRRMVIALAVGIVLGVGLTLYMLLHPIAAIREPSRLAWLLQSAQPLLTALAITGISIAVAYLCTPPVTAHRRHNA